VRRREFIGLLGGAVAAWPLAARAQQSNRVRLVGVLLAMAPSDPEAQLRVKAFEAGLRELGWTEGRNLRLEYRWAPGDATLLHSQATELVGLAPDLILATSTPVLAALRQGTSLPIVFVQVTDPVGGGFVPNLARPGGYLTGFTSFEFTIGSKWLEALKHVAPKVKRVALIFNPDTAPFAPMFWQPVEDAAPSFDVEPIQMPLRDVSEIGHAIEVFVGDGMAA
jgi:putative tryptophan/tyrosine transport system substrate-binding protein